MTRFTSIALCALVSGARAYYPIGMYVPATDVTDHASIDNDQSKMETELALHTDEGDADAKAIYENGGHSKSIVTITLTSPLETTVTKKTKMSGSTISGGLCVLEVYEDTAPGSTQMKLKYEPGVCQVGALAQSDTNTDGCLFFIGSLNDGTATYAYSTPAGLANNSNKRTLQGFSTAIAEKMLYCDNGCPEINASYFMDYYGVENFGDMWVQAAFAKTSTDFNNGNADFGTEYDGVGRSECIKKGISYVVAMLYALHEFEASVAACVPGEKYGNENALHKWDEGVAFYAGSQVGADGTAADGKFAWALANKRCKNFATCGPESGEKSGIAHVNFEQLKNFNAGKEAILQGDCDAAEEAMTEISTLIYIPLIQGTLRYALKVSMGTTEEKGQGEGAAFALGVLPRVYAESPAAAQIIYNAMGVQRNPDFEYSEVKEAFESVYEAMGIDCEQVGGYLNDKGNFYTKPDTSSCVTKCSDDKSALVPLSGWGIDMTCKQLNNLSSEWKESICTDHGGAEICPATCDAKCTCTDDKFKQFVKNNKGKKMSCQQLSRKKNYKSICKKKEGAKDACPITCKGWCSFDKPFAQE